jgi:hypothetical protein
LEAIPGSPPFFPVILLPGFIGELAVVPGVDPVCSDFSGKAWTLDRTGENSRGAKGVDGFF